MSITRAHFLCFLLGTAACAKEHPAPAPNGGSNDACAGASQSAASSVLDVVASHRACTTDTDCTVVELNASCFDVCTRAVAQSSVDAVHEALAAAESGPCATFAAQGCKLIVPPCAPPAAPTCVAGRCE